MCLTICDFLLIYLIVCFVNVLDCQGGFLSLYFFSRVRHCQLVVDLTFCYVLFQRAIYFCCLLWGIDLVILCIYMCRIYLMSIWHKLCILPLMPLHQDPLPVPTLYPPGCVSITSQHNFSVHNCTHSQWNWKQIFKIYLYWQNAGNKKYSCEEINSHMAKALIILFNK